jgi:hypothetical protein
MSDSKGNSLTPASSAPTGAPTSIVLATGQTVDLSFIPEGQRNVLMTQYMQNTLDIARKAAELNVDVATLRSTLDVLATTTEQVARDGNSVTITRVHNDASGRTEIIMGNTETAGKGRLTRTQTGETNWTPYYIFAAIAAVVLIVIAIASHGH